MGVERIQSGKDPRVADYLGVRDGDLMRSRGLFVAEGRLVVRRVIDDPRYRLHSLLINDAALQDLGATPSGVGEDVPIFVGDAATLSAVAGYDVHRGCLALVHRPAPRAPDDVVAQASLLIVADGVANADNIGGLFRNAAAFAAGGVLLSPTCCDPLYRKAIRTSMGATLRVPFTRIPADDWPGVLTRMREAGFTIAALTPRQPSEILEAFAARPRPARLALIVGAEGDGVSPAAESAADCRVRIRMAGDLDSLNLAVAVGIALHALR